MYADPQTITINGVAKTLNRVAVGDMNATYRTADETVQLRISHKVAKNRVRRMARVDFTDIATDPLTSEQSYQTVGVYQVIDEPKVGFEDATIQHVVTGLNTWMTANTNANTTKLLGSES